MAATRPLSPHLSVFRWRAAMAVSIFHRISGNALAFAGGLMFTWWLAAAATSPEAYAVFLDFASGWLGRIVLVGLSWMGFQHLLSGLRHLAMDSGWGYALGLSRLTATWVFIGAILLTGIFWAAVLFGSGVL